MSNTHPPDDMKPEYDRVFTVTDYFDGPRKGIANYRGEPHFYQAVFDDAKDEYSELFRLTPIDLETFQLAMEDWEIWKRWEDAYRAGRTEITTHPALPQEANRHEELAKVLRRMLVTDPTRSFTKTAQFDVIGEPSLTTGVIRPLQVRWL